MTSPRAAINHVLKCIPPFFEEVWDGRKNFEIRLNDRDYREGDTVTLQDYFDGVYSGREVRASVGYVTDFEQKPGFVVFSLLGSYRRLADSAPQKLEQSA